ncbi:MAG: carboxymuconolactone decarboxylase family protein [Nitrosarchaeum sp.]|nr:carboxymuconolactone decarboxylase family protein [Nitrosarchaeum sp.]
MTQHDELCKIDQLFSYLGENTPKQAAAFSELMNAIETTGKVPATTKEAVALGIAITSQCKGCIAFHTKKALDCGLSPEEILEVAWVAVLMGGGPALVHLSHVKEALEEFSHG